MRPNIICLIILFYISVSFSLNEANKITKLGYSSVHKLKTVPEYLRMYLNVNWFEKDSDSANDNVVNNVEKDSGSVSDNDENRIDSIGHVGMLTEDSLILWHNHYPIFSVWSGKKKTKDRFSSEIMDYIFIFLPQHLLIIREALVEEQDHFVCPYVLKLIDATNNKCLTFGVNQ
jgi:gluconate kinase